MGGQWIGELRDLQLIFRPVQQIASSGASDRRQPVAVVVVFGASVAAEANFDGSWSNNKNSSSDLKTKMPVDGKRQERWQWCKNGCRLWWEWAKISGKRRLMDGGWNGFVFTATGIKAVLLLWLWNGWKNTRISAVGCCWSSTVGFYQNSSSVDRFSFDFQSSENDKNLIIIVFV